MSTVLLPSSATEVTTTGRMAATNEEAYRRRHPTYDSDDDDDDNSTRGSSVVNNILLNMEYLEDNITIADDATLSVHDDQESSSSSSSSDGAYQWDTNCDDKDDDSSSSGSGESSSDGSSIDVDESMYHNTNQGSRKTVYSSLNNKNTNLKKKKKDKKISMYSNCPAPTENNDRNYTAKQKRSQSLYSNTTATSMTTATTDDSFPSSEQEQRQRQAVEIASKQQQQQSNPLSELQQSTKSPITTTIPEENTEDDDDDNSTANMSNNSENAFPEDDDISDLSDDDSNTRSVRDDDDSVGGTSSPANILNLSKVIRAVSGFQRKSHKNSNNNSPTSAGDRSPKTMDAIRRSMSVFSAADKQIASWKKTTTTTTTATIEADETDDILACTDDILGDYDRKKKKKKRKKRRNIQKSKSANDDSSSSSSQDDDDKPGGANTFVDRIAGAHAVALEKAGSTPPQKNNSPQRRRGSITGVIRNPLKMLKKMGRSQRNLQSDETDGNNNHPHTARRMSQGSVETTVIKNSIQLQQKSNCYERRGSFVQSMRRASSGTTDENITLEEHHRKAEMDACEKIFDAVTTAVSEIKATPTSNKKILQKQIPKKKEKNKAKKVTNNNERNTASKWQSLLKPSKDTFETIRRRGSSGIQLGILSMTNRSEENAEQKNTCIPTTNERQITYADNIRESAGYNGGEEEVDLNDTKHRIKEAASRFKNRQKTLKNEQLARELRESQEEDEKLEQELMEYEQRVHILEERQKSIVAAAAAAAPPPVVLHNNIYVLIETTLIQQGAVDDTRNTLKIQARLLRSQLSSNKEYLDSLREEKRDEACKSLQLEQLFNNCGLAPAGFDDLMSSQIKLELECEDLNQKLAALGYYDTDSDDDYDPNAYANHDDEDFVAMPTFNRGVSLQQEGSSGNGEDIMRQMMMMQNNNQNHLFPGDNGGGAAQPVRRRSKTIAFL